MPSSIPSALSNVHKGTENKCTVAKLDQTHSADIGEMNRGIGGIDSMLLVDVVISQAKHF